MYKALLLLTLLAVSIQSNTLFYAGKIASSPVQMELTIQNDSVSGTYFYTKYGSPIILTASLSADELTLTESVDGSSTGSLKLSFPQGSMDSIRGTWSGNGKEFPVTLQLLLTYQSVKTSSPFGTESSNRILNTESGSLLSQLPNLTDKSDDDGDTPDKYPAPDVYEMGSDYYSNISVEMVLSDFVVISNSYSEYHSGAAHPMSGSNTKIYHDYESGLKPIPLSEMITESEIARYNTSIWKEFMKEDEDSQCLYEQATEEGYSFITGATTNYYILGSTITFNWTTYEISPYVCGSQEVTLPLTKPEGRKEKLNRYIAQMKAGEFK